MAALKEGKLVARSGWNGKGMFIFMRPADTIKIDVIPNIKSLPQGVKDFFANKYEEYGEPHEIKFLPYLCMKAADESIVNGWLASQTDMLANDWGIIEP